MKHTLKQKMYLGYGIINKISESSAGEANTQQTNNAYIKITILKSTKSFLIELIARVLQGRDL